MSDNPIKNWQDVVDELRAIRAALVAHTAKDDAVHADLRKQIITQGRLRAAYFTLTVFALYANGVHAPRWLFQLMNGIFQ